MADEQITTQTAPEVPVAEVIPEPTVEPQAAAEQVQATPEEAAPEKAEKPGSPAEQAFKESKERLGMATALKTLQTEKEEHQRRIAELEEQTKAAPPAARVTARPGIDAEIANHPALQGLQWSEDGAYVLYRGETRSPESMMEYEDRQALIGEVKGMVTQAEQQRIEAEAEARKTANLEAIGQTTADVISEMRTGLYPSATGEVAEDIDLTIRDMVKEQLFAAYKSGALTEELAGKTISAAFDRLSRVGGIAAVKQFESNKAYAEKYPVKPGTPGGKAPKTMYELTAREKEAAGKRAYQRAATIE